MFPMPGMNSMVFFFFWVAGFAFVKIWSKIIVWFIRKIYICEQRIYSYWRRA